MTLNNPELLLLLLALVGIAYWVYRYGVRLRSRIYTPVDSWMAQRPRFATPTPFKIHWTFRIVGLALLIVGLSRPQEVSSRVKRTVDAIDMVIAFDLSKSMDALDFRPDRRTVAIDTIHKFIERRPDDRIGLVLFSGEAYMAVPMTQDHDILKQAITDSSNRLLQDGTAIGQALAVGVHHLRESTAKSRIIILVTDGDNNMGTVAPETAAEIARGYKIKIYTIGLGKKGKVTFPITKNGRVSYQTLTDAYNDKLLSDIATNTGGRFFAAEGEQTLIQVFNEIDTLEKSKVETQQYVRKKEIAWPWIGLGLLILLLEMLLLHTRWRKIP